METEVKTNLAELRAKRGLGAAQLAAQVGVSRQTVYAIEAGTYVPNTAVSLKLARALETTVEEIFQIEPEDHTPENFAEAIVLGDVESMAPGQPLRLCEVDRNLVAVPPETGGLGLSPSDAVLVSLIVDAKRPAKGRVRILDEKWKNANRILISGCDPSVSILAKALQPQGCELVIAYENSSRSLELLRDKMVHIAGTHLVDKVSGKTDLLPITQIFGRNAVAVFSYAIWQEGLVTALDNPKKIAGIADLGRKDVRIANREPGAGCRRLLDDLLREEQVDVKQVKGYERVITGHLPAARLVRTGEVDCCISTQAVARALSLNFIPLAQKPYHLVIRRAHLDLAPIQTLIERLGHASFRREVEAFTGYNMRNAGDRLV
jgi:molybdate-binding protein/DNA-binding XRE family transcriptional regulator